MKFLKIILLAFFSAVSLFAISEEQIKPTMQKTTQDAIEVLKNANLSKDEKISKIFAVFDPYFDYEQMSKIALSKRYNNLSAEQKAKFNKAFEERLKSSYVDKLLSYKNQTINFKDATKPNENRYFLNADLVGDYYLDPVSYVKPALDSFAIKTFRQGNLLSLHPDAYDNLKKDAIDLYPFLRDAYEQRRNHLIKE